MQAFIYFIHKKIVVTFAERSSPCNNTQIKPKASSTNMITNIQLREKCLRKQLQKVGRTKNNDLLV